VVQELGSRCYVAPACSSSTHQELVLPTGSMEETTSAHMCPMRQVGIFSGIMSRRATPLQAKVAFKLTGTAWSHIRGECVIQISRTIPCQFSAMIE
jgi:hypothetical protein